MTCDGSQNKPFPYVARIIDKYCSIAHIAYSAIKTRLNLPKTHIEYSLGRAEPCVPKRHVLVFFLRRARILPSLLLATNH